MTEEKRKPGRPKKNPEAVAEKSVNVGPTTEELISIIQSLNAEVQALKAGAAQAVPSNTSNSDINELLLKLANRRADEEVVIVHNFEAPVGCTTHIELNGLNIDFRGAGEQRILNWQQFEECVSKYRGWFDKRIILLGSDYSELATKYGVPCVENGYKPLDHTKLITLYTLTVNELEEYINSLKEEDREIVYSFWVGKCYDKEPGFYDRAKVEMLNRISDNRMENLIAYMNGDYLREK